MNTGERIRQLRMQRNMPQQALADSLGVTRQAVAKWESGASRPSAANLMALCRLFGVSWQQLAGPDGAQQRAARRHRLCRRAGKAVCGGHTGPAICAAGFGGPCGPGGRRSLFVFEIQGKEGRKMRRTLLAAVFVCCAVFLCACAAGQMQAAGSTAAPVREELNEWPENEYTALVPQPENGTPAWALWYEEQGVYAVFLTGITRAQGEQYVQALRQAGFEEGEAGAEDASAGYLLHKGGTVLSAAVSEGQLGIYISPGAAQ